MSMRRLRRPRSAAWRSGDDFALAFTASAAAAARPCSAFALARMASPDAVLRALPVDSLRRESAESGRSGCTRLARVTHTAPGWWLAALKTLGKPPVTALKCTEHAPSALGASIPMSPDACA